MEDEPILTKFVSACLSLTCFGGTEETIRLLLNSGANTSFVYKDATPLQNAIYSENHAALNLLIGAGTQLDDYGVDALN